jgi:excisionase family DNA binding protein
MMGRYPIPKSSRRMTYTVEEVAELLGLGRNTAYVAVRNGNIPAIKIGGRYVIPKSVIDKLLNGEISTQHTETE